MATKAEKKAAKKAETDSVLGKRADRDTDNVSVLTEDLVNPASRFVSDLEGFLSDNDVRNLTDSDKLKDSYVPEGLHSSVIPDYVRMIREGNGSVDRLLVYLLLMNAAIVSGCLIIPGYGCYSGIDEEGNLQECPPPLTRCKGIKPVIFEGPSLKRQNAGDENLGAGPPTVTELSEFQYLREMRAASFPEGMGSTDFPRDNSLYPSTATKADYARMTEEAENFSKFMSGI